MKWKSWVLNRTLLQKSFSFSKWGSCVCSMVNETRNGPKQKRIDSVLSFRNGFDCILCVTVGERNKWSPSNMIYVRKDTLQREKTKATLKKQTKKDSTGFSLLMTSHRTASSKCCSSSLSVILVIISNSLYPSTFLLTLLSLCPWAEALSRPSLR